MTLPAGVHRFGAVGKPPLLLLHSSQSNSGQWRGLIQQLGAHFDILAIDLLGYGKAPATDDIEAEAFRFDDELPRVLEAIAAMQWQQQLITLVGHSYGGALALKLALEQPVPVRELVVFEPVAFHVLEANEPARAEIERIAAQMYQEDAEAATRGFVDYWNQPGFFDALPERIRAGMTAQAAKVTRDFAALMGEPHKLSDYRNVTVPVLLLQGKHTQESARCVAHHLLQVLPDAQSETLDCGHMGPVTHPQLVNPAIVDFVTRHRDAECLV
ncbi:alpha/beta hydrolase [Pseudidiomarina gelatinasegens]|uniref:alpha/beta fold hydrolase n=1 Tax=Pseudidiomarina gelatinasegens TaxID=2487740 RepID=UPI0030ECB84B